MNTYLYVTGCKNNETFCCGVNIALNSVIGANAVCFCLRREENFFASKMEQESQRVQLICWCFCTSEGGTFDTLDMCEEGSAHVSWPKTNKQKKKAFALSLTEQFFSSAVTYRWFFPPSGINSSVLSFPLPHAPSMSRGTDWAGNYPQDDGITFWFPKPGRLLENEQKLSYKDSHPECLIGYHHVVRCSLPKVSICSPGFCWW